MIQTNELRLGNLVNYTYKNVVKQGRVTSISMRRIVIDHGAVIKPDSENLQPVPITRECLDKYGFQVLSQYVIYKITGDEKFYLHCPNDFWKPGAEYHYATSVLVTSNVSKPLKYIHELQNAFFILTNHEL
jgi:hypothetical protein